MVGFLLLYLIMLMFDHTAGITAPMRSLDLLRPEAPSSPPRHMESASTTSEIVIEWGSSPPLASIPDSPLFYRVDYSLERPSGGDVINGSVTVHV